jgi:hypothetical protein
VYELSCQAEPNSGAFAPWVYLAKKNLDAGPVGFIYDSVKEKLQMTDEMMVKKSS